MRIEDIKSSIVENVRGKLPTIPKERFYKDPPVGSYKRECFYLAFKDKTPAKKQYFGSVTFDYTFDVVIENKEDDKAVMLRTNNMDALFYRDERIQLYHFDNGRKYERYGSLVVKSFRILENAKDREKNRIRAEVVITF